MYKLDAVNPLTIPNVVTEILRQNKVTLLALFLLAGFGIYNVPYDTENLKCLPEDTAEEAFYTTSGPITISDYRYILHTADLNMRYEFDFNRVSKELKMTVDWQRTVTHRTAALGESIYFAIDDSVGFVSLEEYGADLYLPQENMVGIIQGGDGHLHIASLCP